MTTANTPGPSTSSSSSASTSSTPSDSDIDSVARPPLYRHRPQPRRAPLEQYSSRNHRPLQLLSELKTDRLEGFYNLSFLLLSFSLFYLPVRNIAENGFHAGPSSICITELIREAQISLLLVIPLPIPFLFSYLLVALHARDLLSSYSTVALHTTSLTALVVSATATLFHVRLNPLSASLAGILIVVIGLKQHSFVFTNLLLAEERDRRRAVRARPPSSAQEAPQLAEHEVPYPQNVTLSNLIYFILAPTLVYETGYPRTRAVRPSYVMRYSAQAVSCLAVQYVLIMQFCVPVWRNSGPTQGLWLFYLKLALPSFASWLLMFWGFFHCTLNVIAELTRFADRQFYEEWWNATTLPQFWRWWNSLVHEWCLRHVYLDTVSRHNVRPSAAEFATFFISAVVHEYVCFVAFRMLRPYMFVGMMAQVPLMHISLRWEGSRHGNLVMWTMLFFGQPLTGLMYFRDFVATHGSLMCHE